MFFCNFNLNKKYKEALQITTKYGQEHLLKFYDELHKEEKMSLLNEILEIDFELVTKLYQNARHECENKYGEIKPIDVTVRADLPSETLTRYAKVGDEIIKQGQFAALTMAGGQGTRLGHNGPKGTYNIHVDGANSLFEIQAKRLLSKGKTLGVEIPWYIMTSKENNKQTIEFFEANLYFGYKKSNIKFFTQFMLPMVDFDGHIVMSSKSSIKQGADGHGGIFRAMAACGIVSDMKARGIKYVFIGGIDNVLVKLCDSAFIGFIEEGGYALGGKSLIKCDPYEKCGVFCMRNGHPTVIEYTEISQEMAEARDENGEFIYGDAHILCNMFSIDALLSMGCEGLPYHTAVKKTNFVDSSGAIVTPNEPNAYKFEAFIFDAFERYDNMGIYRVNRETEFAPVKNKEGVDSPETARTLYEAARKANRLD